MKGSALRSEYERVAVMRTGLAILSNLCGALALLVVESAPAAAGSCPSVLVEADSAVQSRWPELRERVRTAFEGRSDVDACATVHLRYVDGAIAMDVALPDGRSTSRIASREDVVAGLEALLLVPESAPSPPAKPPQVAATRFDATVIEVPGDPNRASLDRGPTRLASPVAPSRLRVEISADVGVHRGDGQTRTSVGASSLLDVAGWLVGFEGAVAQYVGAPATSGDSPKALEVGALAGRRLRAGGLALDVVAGPAVELRGSWAVAMVNTASQGMVSTMRSVSKSDGLVPRFVLGSRLTLGARSTLRTFVGIDGEIGETGPIPPGFSRGLPGWMVGLSIGATVGTL
jgi:hypothetical protein